MLSDDSRFEVVFGSSNAYNDFMTTPTFNKINDWMRENKETRGKVWFARYYNLNVRSRGGNRGGWSRSLRYVSIVFNDLSEAVKFKFEFGEFAYPRKIDINESRFVISER